MSENNYRKFQCSMGAEDWSIFDSPNLQLLSPHDSYGIFLERFKNNFNRAFLLRNNNPNKKKSTNKKTSQPWMTDGLIKSCRKKSRLLKVYKKTGSSVAKVKYVTYKNILKQTLRNEERKYYECQFQLRANDSRKTWKLINSLLNKNIKDELPRHFKINNSTVSDNKYKNPSFRKQYPICQRFPSCAAY